MHKRSRICRFAHAKLVTLKKKLSFLLYLMQPGLRNNEFTYHGLKSPSFVCEIKPTAMKLLVAHHSALNRSMGGGCLFSIFIILGSFPLHKPLGITNSYCFVVALNFLGQQA